jgi:transposase
MSPMSQPVEPKSAAQPWRPDTPGAQPSVARGEAAGVSGLENPPPQRWRARRKADVVLRLLRGEPLDLVSRHTGVPVPRLEEWRAQGLAGLEQGLQAREPDDPAQLRLDEATRRVGELSMEVELLRARCEKQGPFAGRRSRT